MAETNDEVFEEVHEFDARVVVVVDHAVGLVDRQAADVEALRE